MEQELHVLNKPYTLHKHAHTESPEHYVGYLLSWAYTLYYVYNHAKEGLRYGVAAKWTPLCSLFKSRRIFDLLVLPPFLAFRQVVTRVYIYMHI